MPRAVEAGRGYWVASEGRDSLEENVSRSTDEEGWTNANTVALSGSPNAES